MKYFLLLLTLPLLLGTCAKDNGVSPSNPVIGRWSLSAMLDSTGKWNAFIPLVPVIIEFRRDSSVDYLTTRGTPQRGCCQPTQYTFVQPRSCPPNASCLQTAGTIRFTNWVSCSTVNCDGPQSWTTISVDETFLDIYSTQAARPNIALRYQRVR